MLVEGEAEVRAVARLDEDFELLGVALQLDELHLSTGGGLLANGERGDVATGISLAWWKRVSCQHCYFMKKLELLSCRLTLPSVS